MTQEEAREAAMEILEDQRGCDNCLGFRSAAGRVSVSQNGFVQFTPGSVFVELVMEIPLAEA